MILKVLYYSDEGRRMDLFSYSEESMVQEKVKVSKEGLHVYINTLRCVSLFQQIPVH